MIHYHGLPITPDTVAVRAISGGHAFVSFVYPDQLGIAVDCAQTFAVDNGAFSAWKKGEKLSWPRYYEWVAEVHRYPTFDFAVIPDVIDGSEEENDALLEAWPWQDDKHIGAPVWHLHESMDRLLKLAIKYPRICLGSSGEFSTIGNLAWFNRMYQVMNHITTKDGLPLCKIHGLRMLDIEIYSKFPFSSADSTNIARNVGIDSKWTGSYKPPTKPARAAVMRERIESCQSLTFWENKPVLMELDFNLRRL